MVEFGFAVLMCVFFAGFFVGRGTNKSKSTAPKTDTRSRNSLSDTIQFIQYFKQKTRAKAQAHLLDNMLEELSPGITGVASSSVSNNSAALPVSLAAKAQSSPKYSKPTRPKPQKKPMDSTSLLLYFGAFLFITSMGVFVGFSEVGGGIKVLAIAVVSIALYGIGMKLHAPKGKYREVALTFTGMGLASAPLIGLATSYYDATIAGMNLGDNVVWALTSVLVFAMYYLALMKLKNTLLSYLMLFSFVSLFESAVSVVDAPVYYFAWALAICGMLFRLISLKSDKFIELKESSDMSSVALIALSVMTSVGLAERDGIGQLCISLALSTAFFVLRFMTQKRERAMNFVSAQISAVLSVSAAGYYFTEELKTVAITVAAVSIVQALAVLWKIVPRDVVKAVAVTAVIMSSLGILFIDGDYKLLAVVVGAFIVLNGTISYSLDSVSYFVSASLAWIALPLVVGRLSIDGGVDVSTQAAMMIGVVVPMIVVAMVQYERKASLNWITTSQVMLGLASIVALLSSFFGDVQLVLIMSVSLSAVFIFMAQTTKNRMWADMVSAMWLTVTLMAGVKGHDEVFAGTAVAALLFNIVMSVHYRSGVARAFSAVHWILAPLVFSLSEVGGVWSGNTFAWAYMFVMFALILSRMIARGLILFSSKSLMSSLTKGASASYAIGAVVAGAMSYASALSVDDGAILASIIVLFVGVSLIWFGSKIEKEKSVILFSPVLAQIVVFTALLEIISVDGNFYTAAASIIVAVAGYLITQSGVLKKDLSKNLTPIALLCVYAAPMSAFISDFSWLHILGLGVAGLVSLHYSWNKKQMYRELSIGMAVLSGMLLVDYNGVDELQIYTHIMAATFGIFAYWRHILGQMEPRENYVKLMLVVATIPLALQAMTTTAGDVYGLWILIEMIAVFISGVMLSHKFITRWGLYVSMAAVLYQLRGLGWLMLVVLSLFVLGIAIFRVMKSDKAK